MVLICGGMGAFLPLEGFESKGELFRCRTFQKRFLLLNEFLNRYCVSVFFCQKYFSGSKKCLIGEFYFFQNFSAFSFALNFSRSIFIARRFYNHFLSVFAAPQENKLSSVQSGNRFGQEPLAAYVRLFFFKRVAELFESSAQILKFSFFIFFPRFCC